MSSETRQQQIKNLETKKAKLQERITALRAEEKKQQFFAQPPTDLMLGIYEGECEFLLQKLYEIQFEIDELTGKF